MFAAIRRASSRVSSLPVARRPGSSSQSDEGERLRVSAYFINPYSFAIRRI